ncbi:MAG: hypothetical protein ACI8QT_000069 [Halioglobus sp.]|jgi:hypothetical protein
MNDHTPIKLRVPRQDLAECTIFHATADEAQVWAQNLPIANTRLVVQNLSSALAELNRVDMAPDVRFNIMEALRPSLHVALSTMSRRFLNQALVMPEEPRQIAELADALYSLATTAYIIVAVHTLQQRDNIHQVNPARLVCESVYRALGFAGKKILQTFQLQQAIPAYLWLEINQLYTLADQQQLAELPVEDKLQGNGTISTAYLQALLLGCCKPNQLRQSDLAAVYRGLHEWAGHVKIQKCNSGSGLFRVDLGSDQPAVYASLYPPNDDAQCRLINTEALVAKLESLKQAEGKKHRNVPIVFDKDTSLPANMLDHLRNSLGSMSTRNFKRTLSGEMLGLSVGLSSIHYHIAGKKTFEQVVHGANYVPSVAMRAVANRFLDKRDNRDGWEQANPHEEHMSDEKHEHHGQALDDPALSALVGDETQEQTAEERYPIYPVHMTNSSPGGYCLEWFAELPARMRAGDIVGVREGGRSEWIIAVIRWVSQLEQAKTLIGVELLSPSAMPYGARVQKVTGKEASLRRVLLLPEIKLVGQPHTLITPHAGFRERQKVILVSGGEEFLIQLQRQTSTTENFTQFDFRYIKQVEGIVAEDKLNQLPSVFDSLWDKI